ncbi:Uma2 family endonuclease [Sphingomonas bacterium]|uniref:Uma2 family endonuclease n=1 Tax=Sphingomonas bacterium TaxID=1895847 RepID=UPI0015754F02|nr:Uma2 family endonuclease [Sphingomonas bacterium]
MRTDPAYRKITADEFLNMDFGSDRKFELADGVIVGMVGGTEPHAWVQGNIYNWLRNRLRGSRCRPYNSDMAVQVGDSQVRFPDVSVHCDQPPRLDLRSTTALPDPTVVIEVLSPSTAAIDQGEKLAEYKAVPSIRTIAFVDPDAELCRTVERLENGWLDHLFSGRTGIVIPALDLTIPHADVFARD